MTSRRNENTILVEIDEQRAPTFIDPLVRAMPNHRFLTRRDLTNPQDVRFILTAGPIPDIAKFEKLELVFSLGAGVDQIDTNGWNEATGLVRMIDPGIEAKMTEYVMMATLYLHRDMLLYRQQQDQNFWQVHPITQASDRTIGIMGLGRIGTAVAKRLQSSGFPVAGWNRSPRSLAGVNTFFGKQNLSRFLSEVDILVCLLPLTPETKGVLDADLFGALPKGASLVLASRGGHLDHQALLSALNSGQLSGAVLDVTDPEPLPENHPFWRHDRVCLTPHIASRTDPAAAAAFVAHSIKNHEAGAPVEGLVDRQLGY